MTTTNHRIQHLAAVGTDCLYDMSECPALMQTSLKEFERTYERTISEVMLDE